MIHDNSDVNNEVFSDMFKLLLGNIPDMEIETWLSSITDEQDLTDEKIIAAINNIKDELKKDTSISHISICHKNPGLAVGYIEAQDDATIADVLLFERLRDKAAFE